ncbi:trypsin-like peptidase domain-containing protein [Rhodoferax sp. 4810]|uniref:Trypsin-like peptidase domain-containing protein n=1 Tax=Thiospirillum jenense TaxID=1653858 RepID=A0A839HHA3_9GAMM|nr:trypsin-like peptidase domain-containing protein [Thiospirillum jenense]MBB1077690.1 trypsin-like peptidase domain-containing protein [Rhodoferax jenense]MBB1127310.1 trypsin-like peptidase domain-containing protein [Thiospirillum jenense]
MFAVLAVGLHTAARAIEVPPERYPVSPARHALPLTVPTIAEEPAHAAVTVDWQAADTERLTRHNARAGRGAPQMVGVVKPLALALDLTAAEMRTVRSDEKRSIANGLLRRATDGSLIWTARLDLPNAGGARLRFDELHLPAGAQLWLRNVAGARRGPYQSRNGSFWTGSLSGEQLLITLILPPATFNQTNANDDNHTAADVNDTAPAVRMKLGAVAIRQASNQSSCDDVASCIEDASCFDDDDWSLIAVARAAVAQISMIDEDGAFDCSGGLIADTDTTTFIPYFLTAHHCVDSVAVAATVETRFNYSTDRCRGDCYWPDTPSTVGAELLHTSDDTDHSLLRLLEPPPAGAWFLGWDSDRVAYKRDTFYRISHPGAAPQAYSTHRTDLLTLPCSGMPRGDFIYTGNINDIGATQGGSSGAPLLDDDAEIVGQLFGKCGVNTDRVCDSFANSTVDGAFAAYYDDVKSWLRAAAPASVELRLTLAGNGWVSSAPVGIDCGSTCTHAFAAGTAVTLTATPAAGYYFTGWTGNACQGSAAVCTVALNQAVDLTANFQADSVACGDEVYRFWHPALLTHFYTASRSERDWLIAETSMGWLYEGAAWGAENPAAANAAPVYRFWSPVWLHHFYTTDEAERDILKTFPDWQFEGTAWYAQLTAVTGYLPVYRFWNPTLFTHFYTQNAAEQAALAAGTDWQYEGIAWYAPPVTNCSD